MIVMKFKNVNTQRIIEIPDGHLDLFRFMVKSDQYQFVKNDDGEHWITLNGGDGDGQHVLINGEGKVMAGAGGKLNGAHLKDVKTKSKNVEKHGPPIPQYPPAPPHQAKETGKEGHVEGTYTAKVRDLKEQFKNVLKDKGIKASVIFDKKNLSVRVSVPSYESKFSREEQKFIKQWMIDNEFTGAMGHPIDPDFYNEGKGLTLSFYHNPESAKKNKESAQLKQSASLQGVTGQQSHEGANQKKFNTYVPQHTNKEAEKFAVENNYVDNAIFGKLNVKITNEALSSLSDHLTEFPELRSRQKAIGSIQQRVAMNHAIKVAKNKEYYRKFYPDKTEEQLQQLSEKHTKKERIASNTWAYAASQGDLAGVFFNEKHSGKDLESLEKDLKRSVETKWHPVGCDTIKSIYDHEYGHQLDYLLDLRNNPNINNLAREIRSRETEETKNMSREEKAEYIRKNGSLMTRELSKYATTNIQEFIAEAWAEYKNNPTPRELAKKVGTIIKDEYERKFGKAS